MFYYSRNIFRIEQIRYLKNRFEPRKLNDAITKMIKVKRNSDESYNQESIQYNVKFNLIFKL